MRNDPYIVELFNSAGLSLDNLYDYIQDVSNQMDIDRATWALDVYEREAGIPINHDKGYDERRSAIKAKWRSSGKADVYLLQQVADSWKNGNVVVDFINNNVDVTFIGEFGIPERLDGLKNALDEVKPAHLDIVYHFMYVFVKTMQSLKIKELGQMKIHMFAFSSKGVE